MPTKVSVRAHAIIFNGKVNRNSIVSYSPDGDETSPVIVPFSTELQSTTSYNGVIIFAPAGFHLPPDLDMPRLMAIPGKFTEMLEKIAAAVPACGNGRLSVICLPL
ncbi:MAG: hypothetical protein NC212_01520 [Staphylococcus sp.]|nr:hypothetical protein [Staphylococcus sp.]